MRAFSKTSIVIVGLLVMLVTVLVLATARKPDRLKPEAVVGKDPVQVLRPRIDHGKASRSLAASANYAAFTTRRESTLQPTTAPANNDFSGAQVIIGTLSSVTGSNAGATKEPGEPNHAGNTGGASVWYRWQAPGNGAATFATAGSDFDTLLAVYTGSNVNNLTLISDNDDANNTLQSALSFNAQVGVIYYIAVDGFDGATGSIVLGWGMSGPIFDSRFAVQVGGSGRFNMGAFPDAFGGAGPNSWDLMYRWPHDPGTSFSTLRIDGVDNIYGSSGTQLESPNDIDGATNRSKWRIGDVEVTQTLEIVFNAQTNQNDVAKISYVVHNIGNVSHQTGLRVMVDSELNYNDGAPFRVPGVGIVSSETEFTGAAVPDTFQAFFDVTDSTHVGVSTLRSGGATAPDRLVLASWPRIHNTDYDYVVTPNLVFTSDSAYALFWNPTPLAPGASRAYVTFYGLAQVEVNLQPPLALGVSGPATLAIVNGQYSPNPFDVVATVLNNGNATATNIGLTLNLPAGLSLAAGSTTQALGDLQVGQEKQASWKVNALPQSSQTTLTYSVDATASNAQTKTVQRQITLGAICSAPIIATQPAGQTVLLSQAATLAVVPGTNSQVGYQWYKGTSGDTSHPVGGAISSSYTTQPSSGLDRTNYWVRVSNACGATNSTSALVVTTDAFPLIFIPGIAGSYLKEGNTELWPGIFATHGRLALNISPLPTISATDAIRSVLGKQFYGPLLGMLTAGGRYREYQVADLPSRRTLNGCDTSQSNPTLFVMAYDWRQDLSKTAEGLTDYIACIHQFYPNSKVNLLTHSFGSLLARRYIIDHSSVPYLDRLISIGGPWLGAPKAINVMETGDFGVSPVVALKSTIKKLAEFFPSVHQLLPSEGYIRLGGVPFSEDGWDINRDNRSRGDYNYVTFVNFLNGRFRSNPGTTNYTFHNYPDSSNPLEDDWHLDQTGIKYYHIYGIRSGLDTISNVTARATTRCVLGVCLEPRKRLDLNYDAGDGTVPSVSAARPVLSNNSFNGPTAVLHPFFPPQSFPLGPDDDAVEHTGLTRNSSVHTAILCALVASDLNSCVTNLARPGRFPTSVSPSYYLRISGVSNVAVADGSHVTYPLNDVPDDGVTGVTSHVTAGDSVEIVTQTGQAYNITFQATAGPLSIEITKGNSNRTPTEAFRFVDVSLPAGTMIRLSITPQGIDGLRCDRDGDGTFESAISPTISGSGAAALDVDPPNVTISTQAQSSSVLVNVSASDSASGIKAVNYSLDGTNYSPYAGPITVDPYQGPVVYAFADDNGANRSSVSTSYPSITPNQFDNARFFVRQHYTDFLNRDPDASGLAYWNSQITQCGPNQACINNKRIDVSNAFFYELEYQQTGSYVYRLYRAAYGNNQPFSNPQNSNPGEAHKLPSYAVFARDRAQVVGGSSLAQSQLDFANAFVQSAEFLTKYPASLDGPGFVDAVLMTIRSDIGADIASQRAALINLLNSGGRGAVMYRLADDNVQTNPIINRAFIDAEYNRAFVFTQYAGYLRRDSDIGGFLFWLSQVNNGPPRDTSKQHAMVCSFITSAEYQLRFSPVVTHSNAECPQ